MIIGIFAFSPINAKFLFAQTSSTVDEFELEIGLGSHQQDRRIYRLIIMRASEQTAQKRKRKLNANAKRRGYKLSEKSYLFAEWTILITNIDTVNLPAEMAWHLYSLRWQIELLFKQFKSILRIHKSNTSKGARLLCEIYGTLIVAVYNSSIHGFINADLWNNGKWELSADKFAKRIQQRSMVIVEKIYCSVAAVVNYLTEQIFRVLKNCEKLKQKKRTTTLEKLYLFEKQIKRYKLCDV